jgi:uncharacterized membrane protein
MDGKNTRNLHTTQTFSTNLAGRQVLAKNSISVLQAVLKFIVPFLLGGALVAVQRVFGDEFFTKIFSLMTVYFFPPFGKETVIPAAVALGIHPLHISLTLTAMDAVTSLFVIWNFHWIHHIPLIGWIISRVEEKCRKFLETRKFVREATYFSLFVFVFIPFQGSGAITASVLGILLSLDAKKVWVVIVLASLFSCLFIAGFSEVFLSLLGL